MVFCAFALVSACATGPDVSTKVPQTPEQTIATELADVPKVGEVEAASPATATIPAPEPKKRGFFSRVFQPGKEDEVSEVAEPAPVAEPIEVALPSDSALVASSQPIPEGEETAAEAAPAPVVAAQPAAQPKRRGLFGRLKKQPKAAPAPVAAGQVTPEPRPQATPAPDVQVAEEAAPKAEEKPKRRGLFARRDKSKDKVETAQPEVLSATAVAPVDVVDAPEAAPEPAAKAEEKPKRRGLFARRDKAKAKTQETANPSAKEAPPKATERAGLSTDAPSPRKNRKAAKQASLAPGAVVPFGEVGMACGLRKSKLGKEIDRSGGYRLYDTNPKTLGQRTFFVTGFKDGCARQITGAAALFGALEVYEILHFGGGGGLAKGPTDAAYRKLRASACPSPRKGPCKASSLKKLSKKTAFVSIYAAKGRSTHLELLLSGGRLVAQARK